MCEVLDKKTEPALSLLLSWITLLWGSYQLQ